MISQGQQMGSQMGQPTPGRMGRGNRRKNSQSMMGMNGQMMTDSNGNAFPQTMDMQTNPMQPYNKKVSSMFSKQQMMQPPQQHQLIQQQHSQQSQMEQQGMHNHSQPVTKICNTFSQTGNCQYGNNCKFVHPNMVPGMISQSPGPNMMGSMRKQFACNKCGSVFDTHGNFKIHIQVGLLYLIFV